MKICKRVLLSAVLFPLIPYSALAQTEDEEEIEELEEFVAEETIDDPLGIIPTREIDSVFGVAKNIVDIPRSVTIVEGSQLESYGIDSVGDIAAVSAGTFSNNQFGIEGAVDIRNTTADNYFRGFKKLTNRGNFRTPIGAADRFEIIKGPPPVNYGVGSVGGLLNYYPKTARGETTRYLEGDTGKITATYGTYDKKKVTFEYGTPFELAGNKGGMYTFLGVEDSGSFYNYAGNRDLISQLTVTYDLGKKWTVEAGYQYGEFDQIQNPGWNRVTQDLVNNGTYITGSAAVRNRDANGDGRLTPDELDNFSGFGQFSNVIPPISVNFVGPGGGITVFGTDLDTFIANNLVDTNDVDGDGNTTENFAELEPIGTTNLSERTGFTETEDYGISRNFTSYLDLDFAASDNLNIKNQLFFDYYDTQRNTTYGFNNEYEGHVMEAKTTAVWVPDFGDAPVDMNVIGGGSYRYTDVHARADFLTEPFSYRDLSTTVIPDDRIALGTGNNLTQNSFARNVNVYDDDIESNYGDLGLFLVLDTTLWEDLNISLGAGLHWIDVTSINRGWNDRAFNTAASDSDSYQNYSFSISYALPGGFVPYFTASKASFVADGQASEINAGTVRDGSYIQDSDLIEGGVKGNFFDNSLYMAFAVYQQNRSEFSAQAGGIIGERTTGYELEARYAATKNFFFTGNATWLKTERKGAQSVLGVPMQFIAEQQGITLEEAYQRYGALRFNSFGGPIVDTFTTNPEEPGRPDKTMSLYGTWLSDFDFTATLGFTWYSDTDIGYFGYVNAPDYFEWNGSMTYNFNDRWSTRINVYNIFDETGFKSQNLFFDDLVLPTQGRRADITVTYAW